jgi:hypothetical protein
MSKEQRIPLIDPILLALRSRRVIIAIVSLAVALLVAFVPELAAVQDALIVVIGAVALALIGGLSWEDAARAGRDRASQPLGTPDAELRLTVVRLLEELGVLPATHREDPR